MKNLIDLSIQNTDTEYRIQNTEYRIQHRGMYPTENTNMSITKTIYIVNSFKFPNQTFIYKVLQALNISVVHILKLIVNCFANHNMQKYNMTTKKIISTNTEYKA